ncbi:MAG: bifunctional 3,4-dihydroxy-2-butanone-4-phosphate synthase/GTP cyclohydrolase II [Bacteroidia bacterium]|nr:MAG: bifunctional 3,4-dihydroxy-2-butanone-4-phosphate synthase/GTP cyclohydrolase II [Bacteroidia bacterium]
MSGNQLAETGVKLNSIEEALEDIKNGRIIIVVDDEDRENEGDFICAAELVTPETVNFMATHGKGLICASLTEERCGELELPMMVSHNTSSHATAFTVSVDLIGHGTTTGISASDRAKTLRALVDPMTRPDDLARPGHIFPLKSKKQGVLRRAGHTEAAVDLAVLAGLKPGGVLVEIMNEDGSMARLPELLNLARELNLKIITIKDLIAYRLNSDSILLKGTEVHLPTEYGDFKLIPFIQISNGLEHVALVKGEWNSNESVLVRVHSSCVTGDIFGSFRCDCGDQLHEAMRMVQKQGKGVIIYLNQEGRGIGLYNKMKAYKLQEEGRDTVEANVELGFKEDERDYGVGAGMLYSLGIKQIRLITNNPVKKAGLEGYGMTIVEIIPLEFAPNKHNQNYLETKRDKMGHFLNIAHYENPRNDGD